MPETVNGPEDGLEWDAVNWAVHEQNVARLRQRIFTAARDGDWPKVRNLQRMMLRSWSNTLVNRQRAADDPAQRWPPHGRDRPGRRARRPGQDGDGGAGAPHGQVLGAGAGAAGVYSQGQWKAETTRYPDGSRKLRGRAGRVRFRNLLSRSRTRFIRCPGSGCGCCSSGSWPAGWRSAARAARWAR